MSKNPSTKASEGFKILIASDCHLGYNEKHPIRGEDSFRTFEEILQAATRMDVDFILLAGDLFHMNRPSMQTMRRAMSLIRKYCFGGDGYQRFIMKNFKDSNYLDPNIKVKHPIFTIHGNHDDPIGMERACCLDLFSTSGLINYFGKHDNVEQLLLKPIIFEKGSTKIIIYGFGSMREERLNYLLQTERFHYLTPDFSENKTLEDELKKYFKILLIHQNRIPRPNIKHVNPYDLTELPDFIVWGHEHQAVKQLEYFEQNKFFILQPGSTVATSLCESEHGDKYYYILNCHYDEGKQKPRFKIEAHRCETVRSFVMTTIDVGAVLAMKPFKSIHEQQQFLYSFCKSQAQNMLTEARCQMSLKDNKPLIRLRIEYKDKNQLFDRQKFELEFNKSVANTDDIVRFIKKRLKHDSNSNIYDEEQVDYGFIEMIDSIDYEMALKKIHVKSVMEQYFALASDQKRLSIYDELFFTEKLLEFVDKNQSDVFKDFFENTKQVMRTIISNNDSGDLNLEDLREQIRSVKKEIAENEEYRRKLQWISRDPFVKYSAQKLKQKVSLTLLNSANQITQDDFMIVSNYNDDDDDFYKSDINMSDEAFSSKQSNKTLKSAVLKKPLRNFIKCSDEEYDESENASNAIFYSRAKKQPILNNFDNQFKMKPSSSRTSQRKKPIFDEIENDGNIEIQSKKKPHDDTDFGDTDNDLNFIEKFRTITNTKSCPKRKVEITEDKDIVEIVKIKSKSQEQQECEGSTTINKTTKEQTNTVRNKRIKRSDLLADEPKELFQNNRKILDYFQKASQ